jgi:hypothetical protein
MLRVPVREKIFAGNSSWVKISGDHSYAKLLGRFLREALIVFCRQKRLIRRLSREPEARFKMRHFRGLNRAAGPRHLPTDRRPSLATRSGESLPR